MSPDREDYLAFQQQAQTVKFEVPGVTDYEVVVLV